MEKVQWPLSAGSHSFTRTSTTHSILQHPLHVHTQLHMYTCTHTHTPPIVCESLWSRFLPTWRALQQRGKSPFETIGCQTTMLDLGLCKEAWFKNLSILRQGGGTVNCDPCPLCLMWTLECHFSLLAVWFYNPTTFTFGSICERLALILSFIYSFFKEL